MTRTRPETIRRNVVVNAPLSRAFRVFTEQSGDFKPREHNLLGVPIAETVFESRLGGHIYDRGQDGTLCKWASGRHGEGWEAVATGLGGDGGWPLHLQRYFSLVNEANTPS